MMTQTRRSPSGPDFSFEDAAGMPCCGIDEVGRGPLAGPVVAAALVLDRARLPQEIFRNINDSKKLTPKRRSALARALRDYADIGIGLCSVEEIDSMNILRATLEAMRRAYANLSQTTPLALVDGNQKPPLSCRITTVVKGDARCMSIAAASIVAKDHRDCLMAELAKTHPHYGWARNAGYGTALHLQAIEVHGITIHHRRSFAPISKQQIKVSSANY